MPRDPSPEVYGARAKPFKTFVISEMTKKGKGLTSPRFGSHVSAGGPVNEPDARSHMGARREKENLVAAYHIHITHISTVRRKP